MAMLPLEPTFGVAELLDAADQAVRDAFDEEVWVEGEIRGLTSTRRDGDAPGAPKHVFFDLADAGAPPGTAPVPGPDDRGATARTAGPDAVLRVKLFDAARRRVNVELRRHSQVRMTDGVRVRIRGRLGIYPRRSQVEFQMTGIDPGFTLAALASERDRVLAMLTAEGLAGANGARPLPSAPVRIGLVTSRGSAAEADFLHELSMSAFRWEVVIVDTPVQGPRAATGVAEALNALAPTGVDLIALVRGGGARTDLAAFDAELVARAVATAPVPVWTGIGHEIDVSAADLVAHRAHKTPTACAAALVELVRAELDRAETAWRHIARTCIHHAAVHEHRLNATAGRIVGATRFRLAAADTELDGRTDRLARGAMVPLSRTEAQASRHAERLDRCAVAPLREAANVLDALELRLGAHDPRQTMAQGWALVRDADGTLVRRAAELRGGQSVRLDFVDGSVTATVDGVAPAPDGEHADSGAT